MALTDGLLTSPTRTSTLMHTEQYSFLLPHCYGSPVAVAQTPPVLISLFPRLSVGETATTPLLFPSLRFLSLFRAQAPQGQSHHPHDTPCNATVYLGKILFYFDSLRATHKLCPRRFHELFPNASDTQFVLFPPSFFSFHELLSNSCNANFLFPSFLLFCFSSWHFFCRPSVFF